MKQGYNYIQVVDSVRLSLLVHKKTALYSPVRMTQRTLKLFNQVINAHEYKSRDVFMFDCLCAWLRENGYKTNGQG